MRKDDMAKVASRDMKFVALITVAQDTAQHMHCSTMIL